MSMEIAYRNFKLNHDNIICSLQKANFPDSAIKFIFNRGYEAREQEVRHQQDIEKLIIETLKKQFA